MLFRSEVVFPIYDLVEDEVGNQVTKQVGTRSVMANEKSLQRNEFYQAAATQFRPEIVFEVRTAEYQREVKLQYEGTDYNIVRTYSANQEIMELVCERAVQA